MLRNFFIQISELDFFSPSGFSIDVSSHAKSVLEMKALTVEVTSIECKLRGPALGDVLTTRNYWQLQVSVSVCLSVHALRWTGTNPSATIFRN
jgi:hypothetical protein